MPQDTDKLIQILDRWESRKVLVVGDFMVDRYVYGNADRLSPDAPVPVLAVQRQEFKLGGAGNVAVSLRALGCEVACLGVVGDDSAARRLRAALEDQGCDVRGLVTCPDRPTTVKHNFVGLAQHRHPQKMFRVDDEARDPVPSGVASELIAVAGRLIGGYDVVCLEDYDKGVLTHRVCQEVIAAAGRAGKPVLVDPAAITDYGKYAHATCVTPNRTEAALATGVDPDTPDTPDAAATPDAPDASETPDAPDKAHGGTDEAAVVMARSLRDSLDLDAVVLTLDKRGALLLQRGSQPRWVSTQARAVYDVTGAGDVVLAMLAAAVANGVRWEHAVRLANAAAGLEVEKFGVVPITLDELLLSLLHTDHQHRGKVRRPDELARELAAHRRQGKRIAFTNGCFDILHAGHVSYLRSAREHGDLLVVAVNGDDSIRRLKGEGRPVNTQDDRLMVLSELESIDYLVVFDEDTPEGLLELLRPDVLVKGGDYRRSEVVGGDFVESYGGKVALVQLVEGRSTTNVIRQIARQPSA